MSASIDPSEVAGKQPDYTSRNSWRICYIIATACIVFAFVLLLAAPQAAEFFEDFDTDFPALTVFIIQSDFLVSAAFVLFAVALIAKEFLLKKHPALTYIINVAACLLTGVAIAIVTTSIVLPAIELYTS